MLALIHNTRVVQVAPESFPVHPSMQWLDCHAEVQPGWSYIDGEFVAPQLDPTPTLEELRAHAVLGPMELADKLHAIGLFDAVNDWANTQGGMVSYAWNRATQFERLHPLVLQAQTSFGMTDEQVDALFNINI